MTDIQQWTVQQPWLQHRCSLGEGPFYEAQTRRLRFVDIKRKQVLSVSVADGEPSLQTTQLDVPVTVTADIEGVDPQDRILVGVKDGLAVLHRPSGTYEMLAAFQDPPPNRRLRSNDGAVDPNGRFWLGSMTDFGLGEFQPEGSLYCFDRRARKEFLSGVIVPNGIGWSLDRRTMYWTHSPTKEIFAFDYDSADGAVTNKRLFYKHPGAGEPDGMRVDAEGCLWIALYGGHGVIRLSPQGEVVGRVTLPARNVTCPQFIGTELFITTAEEDGDAPGSGKEAGGALFRVDVGVRGLAEFQYKM